MFSGFIDVSLLKSTLSRPGSIPQSSQPLLSISIYPLRMIISAFRWVFLLYLSSFSFAHNVYKISVLIFGERDFSDSVHSVKNAYLEVFEKKETIISDYIIIPEFVDGGLLQEKVHTNRLELTESIVCDVLLNQSIAVVIYTTSIHRETRGEYLSLVSSTSYALGFYQIPTIGVMVRDAEFSKKKIYPTFIRPTPSFADESHVFLNLLRRLNYRQVVVLRVNEDTNGKVFVETFERKRKKYKIHVQSYIELEMVEFLNTSIAEKFEEVTSNIIVLYATKADAQRIFAASSDLTGRGKVWIVNEDASKANNVPDGIIASRLSQTPLSALRNSFTIVKHGLNFLNDLNLTISPPTACSKKAVDANWTEHHGPQFLSLVHCSSYSFNTKTNY